MRITNNENVPLGLAVWLLHDDYDYVDEENYISATTLLKPIRHIVLPQRVPKELLELDISKNTSAAIGRSLHDSIEKAWNHGKDRALKLLGYPAEVIDRVLLNPTPEELAKASDPIPVYIEQRNIKTVRVDGIDYRVGGKFDMILEGIVMDNKSTTAYTWMYGNRDDDYKLQGSIYRWLNPDKITEDFIRINYIFTDWSKTYALSNPNYPQKRLMSKDIPLMSIEETELWIKNKIRRIAVNKTLDEIDVEKCSDQDLWLGDTQYKYYLDPLKTSGRSTKNFDNHNDAKKFMAEKGNKGVIVIKHGEPKRCEWCAAFAICTQRKELGL